MQKFILTFEINDQRSSIVNQPAVPERENTEEAIKLGTDDKIESSDPIKLMRFVFCPRPIL